MNRFVFPSLMLFCLATGCAAQGGQRLSYQQTHEQLEASAADGALASAQFSPPASALVFDLPVASDIPPLDLDRQSREPGAFVGFEGPSIEYHTVLINNTQNAGFGLGFGCGLYGPCDFGDSYQRQDLIQRTSVRYR
jgi:hypothetical protein